MGKQDALASILNQAKQFYAMSDALWDHPELGYQEEFAAESYIQALRNNGFEVEEKLTGIPTAFCGTYGKGHPVIGILAEFDALDGLSQVADLPEKKPLVPGGVGHGCGHNLLGVGSLAAAIAVKEYLAQGHSGTVKLFGCPAEEGGAGKSFMARDGAFDGLDAALTWHPGDNNSVIFGSNLANYQICYHFKGKSSHAGLAPELGRSALDACELMNVGVQFLREHVSTQCRIHYAILNTGGTSPGVVQAAADVLYLMRAPSLPEAHDLRARIDDIAKGAALMTGTTVEIEFVKACSNVLPNRTLSKVLQQNLEELGGPSFSDEDRAYAARFHATMDGSDSFYKSLVENVTDDELREALMADVGAVLHEKVLPLPIQESCSAASSDVGDVSVVCPTAQLAMATMPSGTAMHSWQEVAIGKSEMAKKGMLQAAKILAASAIDLLDQPDLIQAAKQEMQRRTGGTPFLSPIPKDARPPMKRKES